jgi:hypothetical protein
VPCASVCQARGRDEYADAHCRCVHVQLERSPHVVLSIPHSQGCSQAHHAVCCLHRAHDVLLYCVIVAQCDFACPLASAGA